MKLRVCMTCFDNHFGDDGDAETVGEGICELCMKRPAIFEVFDETMREGIRPLKAVEGDGIVVSVFGRCEGKTGEDALDFGEDEQAARKNTPVSVNRMTAFGGE